MAWFDAFGLFALRVGESVEEPSDSTLRAAMPEQSEVRLHPAKPLLAMRDMGISRLTNSQHPASRVYERLSSKSKKRFCIER